MADENDNGQPDVEPMAWDRIGRFFGDMATVWQGIAERNVKLWADVSDNVRRSGRYPADQMTTDAARAMNAAMDNLEDLWNLLTRPPEAEQVATSLRTVFLVFRFAVDHWSVADPVWIRVPYWNRDKLPDHADVHLDGDPARTKPLADSITVSRRGRAYLVEVADVPDLEPGIYAGLIVADDRALADLRILVRPR